MEIYLIKIFNFVMVATLITGIFMLGWSCNDLYKYYTNKKSIDGLRFVTNNSQVVALESAKEMDEYGDWVCINVKGMDYKKCVETSSHECGHELFAEILEKNPSKVEKVFDVLKG